MSKKTPKRPGTATPTPAPAPPKSAAPAPRPTASTPDAPAAHGPRLKVRATQLGYYDHVRRREGDVFTITDPKAFSSRWMEYVHPRTPEKVTTSNQAIQAEHDAILATRMSSKSVPPGGTSDDDPIGE